MLRMEKINWNYKLDTAEQRTVHRKLHFSRLGYQLLNVHISKFKFLDFCFCCLLSFTGGTATVTLSETKFFFSFRLTFQHIDSSRIRTHIWRSRRFNHVHLRTSFRWIGCKDNTNTERSDCTVQGVCMNETGNSIIQNFNWNRSIELLSIVDCFLASRFHDLSSIGQQTSYGLSISKRK